MNELLYPRVFGVDYSVMASSSTMVTSHFPTPGSPVMGTPMASAPSEATTNTVAYPIGAPGVIPAAMQPSSGNVFHSTL